MTLTTDEMEKALRDAWIEILALQSALIHSGKVTESDLATFRVTAEPIVDQKLRKLRRTSSGRL